MKGPVLLAILLSALVLGCAFDRRHWLANRDEYELYRQSKVAETLEDRLHHAWGYLQKYPHGKFRQEVRAWFRSVERDYYLYSRPSRKRLKAYLAALPDGPHATEARARIAELEVAAEAERRQERKVLERVRAVGDRLQAAEASRERFVESISGWVTLLSSLDAWGVPADEIDGTFMQRYREAKPAARCEPSVCVKQVTLSYEIPVEKELNQRIVVFDVILALSDGALESAELMGPDLFSRLGEALQRMPVAAENAQARAEAIGVSRQLLATLLEQRFPEASCARETVSPMILERVCHGTRVSVIAAPAIGGEDRLLFEPAPKPRPSGAEASGTEPAAPGGRPPPASD